MAFGRGNQTTCTPWQGVHFFTNTVITKIIETQCCDESPDIDKQHW